MRRNDRSSEDKPVQPSRADTMRYHKALAKVCPMERWAVIAHRAVTAAEKGDSRAREWLSTFLLGKPDQMIADVSSAYASTLVRQVVTALGAAAERSISDEPGRKRFKREAREALTGLLPPWLVEESTADADQGLPQFIMDMTREFGPEVMDKLYGGFLAFIIRMSRKELGKDVPLPEGLERDLRAAMNALVSATAPEESTDEMEDGQTP